MLEPGLKQGSSPEPVEPGSSATPAPATGAAKSARGGTGFNDAPAVGPGVWKDRLLPGQTRFYRVPVDWGQQLFATAEFANAEKVTDDTGYSGDGLRIELFNTARGAVTYKSGSYDGEQAAVGLLTPAAGYTNRVDSGADYVRRAMRFSGWYYVAVSLHAETRDFIDGGVPFTLRLKTPGEARPGPAYRSDAAKAGFGVTSDDREAASEGVVPSGGSAGGRMLLAFTAFGAGGALLAGLAAWTLVARRRPADTAQADGVGGGDGNPRGW
jgi:hypothetical protein